MRPRIRVMQLAACLPLFMAWVLPGAGAYGAEKARCGQYRVTVLNPPSKDMEGAVAPVRVCDNGTFTFFESASSAGPIGVIYQALNEPSNQLSHPVEGRVDVLVNWHMEGRYQVAETVTEAWHIRRGVELVKVERIAGIDGTEADLDLGPDRPPSDPGIVQRDATYVHAVLDAAVNGQLPGPVMATVWQPVFSIDRHHILIPRGSRIVAFSQPGDMRTGLCVKKLVHPDGRGFEPVEQRECIGVVRDTAGRVGLPVSPQPLPGTKVVVTFSTDLRLGQGNAR